MEDMGALQVPSLMPDRVCRCNGTARMLMKITRPVFCCVGALAILDELHRVDTEALVWWLAERQLKCGGLNGRPEKKEDVCYSWWVLSSLNILGRTDAIEGSRLTEFILAAQDTEGGGIADRPGDIPDVFHTLFGVAGLALLGFPGLKRVDPRFCMPVACLQGL